MNPFEFSIPQNIIVGAGTLAKLPECAKKMGGTHAMILSGPTLKKMGVVDSSGQPESGRHRSRYFHRY